MIPLTSKSISKSLVKFLSDLQYEIDAKSTFSIQKNEAKRQWVNKKSTKIKTKNIDELKKALYGLCVGEGICNYCEQNEANDIEHIYPKGFFPKKCFTWDNYILACPFCNTHHKSDNFAIFHPNKNDQFDLKRGNQPPNDDAVFINPRTENAMDFLFLDFKTFRFTEIETDKAKRKYKKGNFTKELLKLNERQTLVDYRKNAAERFLEDLKRYLIIKNSTSKQEILNNVSPLKESEIEKFDGDFNDLKNFVLQNITEKVKRNSHQTVWQELKRQKDHLIKTKALFDKAPEALNW